MLTSLLVRVAMVALTMGRGHSVDWRGYWRRWQHAA